MIVNKYANGSGGGSGSGVTPAQVQTLIDRSLAPYWDSAATESAIAEAVSGISVDATVLHAVDNTDGKFSNSLFNKGLNPGDVFTTYYQGSEEETIEEDWEGDWESVIMSGAEFRNFENDGTHVINNFNSNLNYAKKEEEEPKRQNKVADEAAENSFSNVEFWFGTSKKYGEGITYHLHYDKENEELVIDSEDEETEFVISQEKENYIVSVVEDKTRDLFSIGYFGEEVDYFNPVTEKDETYIVSGYSVGAINMEVKIVDRSATKSAEPISYYFTKFNSSDYINGTRTFIPKDYDGVYVLKDEIKYDTVQLATQEYLDMSLSALRQEVYPRSDTYTKNEVNNLISAATSGNASDSAITQIQAVLSASGIVVKDPISSAETITDVIAIARKLQTDENVISTALNELHDDIAELSGSSVDLSAYWTSAETQTAIDSAITPLQAQIKEISGATPQIDLSAYYTSAQTEDAITSKNYVTSAQVETQIVSKNYITSAETANFVTSAQVETQITSKGYATVSQIPTVPTSNTAFTNDAGYITDAAIENLVTSAQVETQIDTKAAAYTPTSGFSTINGSAITNGGNIVIEGGADMSAYYTSAQTEDAISAATSGKADKPLRETYPLAVSTLHINSGNYDLVLNGDYGQNIGDIWTPRSNGQAGQILVARGGQSSPVWSAVTFITSADAETQIEAKGYATVSQIPTSNTAFTNDAGYITSAATANMVTSTSVSTIWKGTQAQYDAIVDKDPNTFYIIVNN